MSIPDGLVQALADRYTIVRRLGEGGMATVYLAEDVKHERQVAIKVLKPELAAVIGGERFVTEIKTTASLQHPHILPLFDSGEADGFLYYVMPYIDGETLRDRLSAERQLPVEESVKLIRQCADALDYAHRHGVIHRDIKPENILLHEGNPVVADFGIALAISAAGGGRLTETGLSLGTPHYMSPEQATADRDLTSRSDVYSLGAVLYEMLAGDPPHTGPSAQAILMRILTEDPRPITDQRRSVPPNVAAAVAKSLEKLPADRFESAAAFSEALADRSFAYTAPQRAATASAPALAPAASRAGSWWTDIRSVAALAIAVVAMAALGFALRGGDDPANAGAVVRLPFPVDDYGSAAISHDGSLVAYQTFDGIWLQPLDETEPRLLSENGSFPAFSPDDQWVVFTTQEALLRVPVAGGTPITITAPGVISIGAQWADDGRVYYTTPEATYAVPWNGEGDPERILEGGLLLRRNARLLPGTSALIYTEQLFGGTGATRMLDLDSGEDRLLIEDAVDARYVPTGHLLFGRGQSLIAVPFDVSRLEITGSETAVLDSVGVGAFIGIVSFSVSETGTALYNLVAFDEPSDGDGTDEMVFVENGVATPVGLQRARALGNPLVSPDGRHVAYMRDQQSYVYDLVVGTIVPLSSEAGPLMAPTWRPDGQSLDGVGLASGIAIRNVVPRSTETPTIVAKPLPGQSLLIPGDWTSDGEILVVQAVGAGGTDLWTLRAGDTIPQPYLDSDWIEQGADVSPDDAWVAYQSNWEGELAIYVRSFPEPGPAIRISPGRGGGARWSPEGDRVFFMSRDSMYAARVDTTDGFAVTEVEFLFSGPYETEFDVMPDGRFVMVRNIEDETAEVSEPPADSEDEDRPTAFVVVNWFEEMKARLGGSDR